MLNMKSFFSIAAVFHLFETSHQAVDVVKNSIEFPDRDVYFSDYSFKDALLVYAVCENPTLVSGQNCTIYQAVSPYLNISRSCNLTLDTYRPLNNFTDMFVASLNPDTALIFYLEKASETILDHYGTIDLNKCTVKENYIFDRESNNPLAYWQLKNNRTIVRYKMSFDAFFKFSSCEEWECKVAMNSEGKYIKKGFSYEMEHFPYFLTDFSAIDSASSDKGYAYRKYKENKYTHIIEKPAREYDYITTIDKDYAYVIQKPNQSEKVLTTVHEDPLYDMLTTSNNKINIYIKAIGSNGSSNGNMTLLQYDADGNNVLTTDLPDIGRSSQVVNIYNIPEGGSILLLADVEEATDGCSKIKSFNLVKIDAIGNKVGELQMQGLEDKTFYEASIDRRWRYIWKNRQGGYCATIVGPTVKCTQGDKELQNDMQIIENCFTDADFSN